MLPILSQQGLSLKHSYKGRRRSLSDSRVGKVRVSPIAQHQIGQPQEPQTVNRKGRVIVPYSEGRPSAVVVSLSFLVCGVGVGWLAGLAASPTVAAIVAALLALVGAARTSLTERGKGSEVSPVPIAAFILGLATGASGGVYARANDWLGIKPARVVAEWSQLGLDRKTVLRNVFEAYYAPPPPRLDEKPHRRAEAMTGVLFSEPGVPSEQCERFRGADDRGQLAQEFASSPNDSVRRFSNRVKLDSAALKALVEFLCPDTK